MNLIFFSLLLWSPLTPVVTIPYIQGHSDITQLNTSPSTAITTTEALTNQNVDIVRNSQSVVAAVAVNSVSDISLESSGIADVGTQ